MGVHRHDSGELTPLLLLRTFITGGVLGVLGASVLEAFLLHPSPWLFGGVGLIEEAVKLAALMVLTRDLRVRSVRDGMILGRLGRVRFRRVRIGWLRVHALFTVDGLSLMQVVQTELLRGLLAPVGHGLWTAILGGVLVATSTNHRFAITRKLAFAYVVAYRPGTYPADP